MFFKKKNDGMNIIKTATNVFNPTESTTEKIFQDELVLITKMIQDEQGYSTNKKLEMYNLISKLSNCTKNERIKYSKKLEKLIK